MPAVDIKDRTVVLTGTFSALTRNVVRDVLIAAGAKVTDRVSSKTDLLFIGEDAGSQLAKARALKIPVHDEADLLATLAALTARASRSAAKAKPAAPKSATAAAPVATIAQRAALSKKLAAARSIVDGVHARQIERWGLTLPELLRCWLRLFAMRPDIDVRAASIGAPTPSRTLASLVRRLPPEALALAAGCGAVHFWWICADARKGMKVLRAGHDGGHLNLVGFKDFHWWARPADRDLQRWWLQAMFDEQVESSTYLSHDEDEPETEAVLVFDDVDDGKRYPMGTVEEYLTLGARRGFVGYWPKPEHREANDLVARLFERSVPRDTPEANIRAGLVARGLTASEAAAVWRWLGRDAVLLLPR